MMRGIIDLSSHILLYLQIQNWQTDSAISPNKTNTKWEDQVCKWDWSRNICSKIWQLFSWFHFLRQNLTFGKLSACSKTNSGQGLTVISWLTLHPRCLGVLYFACCFTSHSWTLTNKIVDSVAHHVCGLGGAVEPEVFGHRLLLLGRLAHLLQGTGKHTDKHTDESRPMKTTGKTVLYCILASTYRNTTNNKSNSNI